MFLNLPSRLAKKLVALAEAYGKKSAEGIWIDLEVSQEELGDFVGTTRESINKQMKQWRDEGLARMEQGRITILNPRRIQALAGMIDH